VVNQSRKKAGFFFSAGAQIRNYGPSYWCHQCQLIAQVSFQKNFEDITVQLSLGNNCILSYAQVCFFRLSTRQHKYAEKVLDRTLLLFKRVINFTDSANPLTFNIQVSEEAVTNLVSPWIFLGCLLQS
jgi:hypothetical protein